MRTVIFHITYHTVWGENLYANVRDVASVELRHAGNGLWFGTVAVDDNTIAIDYSYTVRRADGSIRAEWGPRRHVVLPEAPTVALVDSWHDRPASAPFYSSAVRRRFDAGADSNRPQLAPSGRTLIVRVAAPEVEPQQWLAVAGSTDALGNWEPTKAPAMTRAGAGVFELSMPMPQFPVEWKILIHTAPDTPAVWELSANRRIEPALLPDADAVLLEAAPFATPLPLWRGSGVAIPVFSLRTDADWGIGDFADIADLAAWAADAGMSMIQILPVNDTTVSGTWYDSYPYNGISTFALNPMYIRPDAAGVLADEQEMAGFRHRAAELNESPTVNYEAAFQLKCDYMRRLYRQEGEATLSSADFREFVSNNSGWLMPYMAFCILRDRHHTADMSQWGEFATYDYRRVKQFTKEAADEAGFHAFVQYHLHRQLLDAAKACHDRGIALKGDIPIGISRTSVDAWIAPQLFNLQTSAGAPPDDFAILGQNWGFPTYNWEVMTRDGFAWWKARLRKMSEYFDAYRIDHVLGFFRIWQIPLTAIHGLLGVFYPALPISPDEMHYNFGFEFNEQMTHPYITDEVLAELFGESAARVVEEFLTGPDSDGRYSLKPEFATQRAVRDYFYSIPDDGAVNRIYNGLLSIIDDVLFIADPNEEGKYHPRIAAADTFGFSVLSEQQQDAFRRMYDDFYYHRSDNFWREKALWKLPPLIDSTRMLCCAEDLGMIPPCVPSVMKQLEILSLKVQRMPSEFGREFGDPATYSYYSVCTTSTHDMDGIRQWWEENQERTARYFHTALHLQGNPPYYAEPWICDRIIAQHLAAPSMLCVLPLQDWLSIDGDLRRTDPREEQINDPANPANNWNYRMHLTVAQLAAARQFTSRLRSMSRTAGR